MYSNNNNLQKISIKNNKELYFLKRSMMDTTLNRHLAKRSEIIPKTTKHH